MSGSATTEPTPRKTTAELRARLDARFRGPLMVYFLRRKFPRPEAEDLTQEVFVRMLGRKDDVPPDNGEVYIFQIAANLLRDRARRGLTHSAGDHASLDAPVDRIASHPALVEERSPERVLLAQESLAEAMQALDELSERTRHIYILHRLEKMRHKEIASLLGLSVSAVEKHVIRAVAHLAERCGRP